MTTKDILNQMEKSFDEKFPEMWGSNDGREGYDTDIKETVIDFFSSNLRTLLESFGEEIMSASIGAIPTSDDYAKGWNDSRQENYKVKSLKVKEIISGLNK